MYFTYSLIDRLPYCTHDYNQIKSGENFGQVPEASLRAPWWGCCRCYQGCRLIQRWMGPAVSIDRIDGASWVISLRFDDEGHFTILPLRGNCRCRQLSIFSKATHLVPLFSCQKADSFRAQRVHDRSSLCAIQRAVKSRPVPTSYLLTHEISKDPGAFLQLLGVWCPLGQRLLKGAANSRHLAIDRNNSAAKWLMPFGTSNPLKSSKSAPPVD